MRRCKVHTVQPRWSQERPTRSFGRHDVQTASARFDWHNRGEPPRSRPLDGDKTHSRTDNLTAMDARRAICCKWEPPSLPRCLIAATSQRTTLPLTSDREKTYVPKCTPLIGIHHRRVCVFARHVRACEDASPQVGKGVAR